MRKTKVKIIYKVIFMFAILLLYIFIGKTYAVSIDDIDIDVYIDKNGDAHITETWKANLYEGTEGYRTFSKLGNSEISDFQVSDDTGVEYQYQNNWWTSESFENKAYKCGIKKFEDEAELCWGISNYGNRTYVLKYKISNLIQQYTDTQGIYFNFLNLDLLVYNAKITIHSDFSFSLENSRIWAFGTEGEINFLDGSIVFNTKKALYKSDYMVVMVRFQSNIFNTTNNVDKSFDQIYEDAMGETNYQNNNEDINNRWKKIWKNFLFDDIWRYFFGSIIIGLIIEKIFFKSNKKRKNISLKMKDNIWFDGQLTVEKKDIKLPTNCKIEYCSQIPFNNDIFKAYWAMSTYKMEKIQELKKNLIGAILLKWIEEDKIAICKNKRGVFDIFGGDYAIDLTKDIEIENPIEKELFEILKEASGTNQILEPKEFKTWSIKNFRELEEWFSSALYYAENKLEIEQFIVNQEVEKRNIFSKYTIRRKVLSSKLKEETIKLKGLKKYLEEYSLIKEKDGIEVKLWEDYLIFAQLFGIATKVGRQFKEIYPELDVKDNVNVEFRCIAIMGITNLGVNGMIKGHDEEERRIKHIRYPKRSYEYSRNDKDTSYDYSGNDRDSGGGGSSYSDGGSSAGGSSGGGFR